MEYGATFSGQRISGSFNNLAQPRQAFAASPVNVIDSVVITQETNTSVVLVEWSALDPSITVNSNLRSAQAVRLFLNWSDQNGTIPLQEGDYFTFVIPDIFNYDYVVNATDVPITNPGGEVVATYSIYDNSDGMKEVRITFTDYVESHTNISGDFWMLLFVGRVDSTEIKDIEFIINDTVVAEGEVTVNPGTSLVPRNSKTGFSSPTRSAGGYYIFEWDIYINMGQNIDNGFNSLANFSFSDIIPEDSPHVFLTDEIRQELGILPGDYQATIGEYTGADSTPLENRYQLFLYHYNSTGASIWYNFIDWNTLANGLTTIGINGDGGLNVSDIAVTDKLFTANLGTLTRPTVIRFFTIATVKMSESALGDSEVAGLFRNTFRGSYGEDLTSYLAVYRFEAGGSAQGISGDYSFTFTKVNVNGIALSGAMFSLFTSDDLTAGADRFVFSGDDGSVTFNHLPAGVFYLQETVPPNGYIPNSTIYRVVISSSGGFEIYYGTNFENRLSDIDNRIVNISEFEFLPVSVTLTGTKNLTGIPLESGMFSFVVKDGEGSTTATGINNADGSIAFSRIEFNAPGVYAFTVEEVRGSASGIIYDGSIFTVTVTVTDDGSGNLIADVTYPVGGIVFNNSYVTTTVSVTFAGTKTLAGIPLESGMFSFVVKDGEGNTVATGINNADGSIAFSSIEFNAPGVYAFTVEEVRGSSSGIIYDGSIFTVTVTVTDDGSGNLIADITYPVGGIVFNNSYVTTPVSVTLTGTKTLAGMLLESGMFSFVVKDGEGNTVATGINNADGSIAFSRIDFDAPGVYSFTVEEVRGSSGGIIYDGSVFTVTVTVTDDGSGNLIADVTYPVSGIVFYNRFEVQPVSVTLTGVKNLTGKNLTGGMFSFLVKDKDGSTVATGTNDANGSILFSSIEFDVPGVYTFTVEEVRGSSSGIIYDGSIFTVTVVVTYDRDGNLTADVTHPVGGAVFNNVAIPVRPCCMPCHCRPCCTPCCAPRCKPYSEPHCIGMPQAHRAHIRNKRNPCRRGCKNPW